MKNEQAQFVEEEYINSMLNMSCCETGKPDVQENIVNQSIYNNGQLNKHSDIECKIFSIAGLDFALPLSAIESLLKQQEVLLDNKNDTQTGIYIGNMKNDEVVDVIDLTCLIMKGTNNVDYLKTYDGKPVDILLLKGPAVGIVYEKEIDTQTVSQLDVCWRNTTSDRTWLAGTVMSYGFSLLDPQGVLDLLNNTC